MQAKRKRDLQKNEYRGKTHLSMVTAAQEKLLFALSRLHFLTAEQIARLWYSRSSASYVHHLLRKLHTAKLVERFPLARPYRFGGNPFVYTLSYRGVSYLKKLGIDAFKTHHTKERAYSPLTEAIVINDFLIAATLLQRTHPNITLPQVFHERTIRHLRFTPVPDAWMEFLVGGTRSICIWLEIDLGTEREVFFKQKISAILDFEAHGYISTFKTRSLTVAIAILTGQNRAHLLLTWIEEVLSKRDEKATYDLFRVAPLSPGELHPESTFLKPLWHMPFTKQRNDDYRTYPLLFLS